MHESPERKDCTLASSNRCDGGDLESAYVYLVTEGIAESSRYRNVGGTQTCQKLKHPATYWLQNAGGVLLQGNEDMLKLMLLKFGPLPIGIGKQSLIYNSSNEGIHFDQQTPSTRSCFTPVVSITTQPARANFTWEIMQL